MSKVVSLIQAQALPVRWSDERSSVAAKLDWHNEVVRDAGLRWPAKVVAGYLLHVFRGGVGEDAGIAWPSHQTIADDLGISSDSAKRGVQQLVSRGWLMKSRASRTSSNRYCAARNTVIATAGEARRERLRQARQLERETRREPTARGLASPVAKIMSTLSREGQPALSERASQPSHDRAGQPPKSYKYNPSRGIQ